MAVAAALALALRGNLFATALQWLKSRLSEWSDRHKTESDKKWGPSNTIAATSNALPSVRRPQPAKVALSEVDKRKLEAQFAQFALDSMKKPPPPPPPPPPPLSAFPATVAVDASPSVMAEATPAITNAEPSIVAAEETIVVSTDSAPTTTTTTTTTTGTSLKGLLQRDREARKQEALKNSTYGIRKFEPSLAPVAAGVSVSLLAAALASPLALLVPLGVVAEFVARRARGEAAEGLRALGAATLNTLNYLIKMDDKLRVTERATDAVADGLDSALGPEGVSSLLEALDPVWKSYSSLSSTLGENQQQGAQALKKLVSISDLLLETLAQNKDTIAQVSGTVVASTAQMAVTAVSSAVSAGSQVLDRVGGAVSTPEPPPPPPPPPRPWWFPQPQPQPRPQPLLQSKRPSQTKRR